MRELLVGIGLLLVMSASASAEVSFAKQIAPILRERCLSCHAGKSPKGDLNLTTRALLLDGGANGPAFVAGKPEQSLLFKLIAEHKMPPKEPLAPEAVALVKQWIAEGAKWEGPALEAPSTAAPSRGGPEWWALQPIQRPNVPTTHHNPIDAFVAQQLANTKLGFNPEADRRTLIRRVSIDLTGLAPTPEDVDAFVNDRSPLSYEKLVDRLLASPAYGERWARHWLDVVRFGESSGYEVNNPRPNAWRYRDYVIRAFNRDLPFGQFVREQLAGDTLPDADELTQAATGFLVGGSHDLVGNQTEEGTRQIRSDDLFDMVSTTSTAFLGLTVGCARCHDHKFDPITQRDFYALEAMFAGVYHEERPLRADTKVDEATLAAARHRLNALDQQLLAHEPIANAKNTKTIHRPAVVASRNTERFNAVNAKYVRMTIHATNTGSEPCLDEIEIYSKGKNVALGAKTSASSEYPNNSFHKIVHLTDGKHGNSRSWISTEAGRGWAQIELSETVTIDRIVWGRDREAKFQDRLATRYEWAVSQDGKSWQTVAGDWDRGASYVPAADLRGLLQEQSTLQKQLARSTQAVMSFSGAFRQPGPTHMLKRGDVMQRGELVAPAGLHAVQPPLKLAADAPEKDRRLALAQWLADPRNPLPSRVYVNRLWHHHFGQGIVNTPSDFGFNGGRPSHAALLDWLASEFVANGGYTKPLHRLMVLSQTYRQASTIDPTKHAIDQGNRNLWRFAARRMEAEAIRDNLLQTSGSLNRLSGGPGYMLWNTSNYVTIYAPKNSLGVDEWRRMIYQFKPRTQQDNTFGVFDCPDATGIAARRSISTTALQALNMLNDEFIHDHANRFAKRVRDEVGTTVEKQIEQAFRHAFQRVPTARERDAAVAFVKQTSLEHLCRMLFNSSEFLTME